MLLAVDVGNTQTVIGLFEGDTLNCHWRITTQKNCTSYELLITLSNLLALEGIDRSAIGNMVLASVVPALKDAWCRLAAHSNIPTLVVNAKVCPFLPIRYSNPAEIGADRLADAVAAVELYGAPVVVVDLGTATNIEVVDKDGAFLGDIICPGFNTSADALFSTADRIPRFDVQPPERAIGTSTRMAVNSGLIYGEVARIDGLVQRVFDELGYRAPVVVTGGLAGRISGFSKTIDHVNKDLTLDGLRIIFERNANQ
ncbi:MAG: type III pantothenate kinase [Coriobacteriales bacterium]|nr:type III pantothenate kinase [Coriobacteriales bacterium]